VAVARDGTPLVRPPPNAARPGSVPAKSAGLPADFICPCIVDDDAVCAASEGGGTAMELDEALAALLDEIASALAALLGGDTSTAADVAIAFI
jgi:D-arabinose 5-phosphate isomerase GutQ